MEAPKERQARAKPAPTRSATSSRATRSAQRQANPASTPAPSRANSVNNAINATQGYVASRTFAGTKTDTPITEVPQSIDVITPDQLRDQAPRTVGEAVRYTAGVVSNPYGDYRYDWISMRGFSGTANFANGLRQPGNNFLNFRTEPYGLERIDVIKGPVSVLYGQVDPAGLIDRISKRPTDKPINEVELTAGSYDRYQGAFDLGGALDKDGKLLYRLTGVVRDSNTEVYGTPDDRKFIAPSFTYRPDIDTTFTFLSSYTDDKSGPFKSYGYSIGGASVQQTLNTIGSLTGRPNLWDTYKNTQFGVPGFDRWEQTQYSVGYQFEHHVDDVWTIRQNLRYANADVTYNYINTTGYDASGLFAGRFDVIRSASSYHETLGTFAVDNQAQAKFNTGWLSHTLLLGVDYQNNTWSQTQKGGVVNGVNMGPTSPINLFAPTTGGVIYALPVTVQQKQDSSQIGAYAQDQIRLDRWLLTVGVRQDSADQDTSNYLNTALNSGHGDHATTGRAGLTYLADNGLAPYVSWATSFVPQIGADRMNQPFQPTTGEMYETGVKYQPNANTLLTFAAFDITQRNVLTPDPVDPQNFNVQTGAIRSRGIELQGRTDLGSGWKLLSSFTYQDVRVTADNAGNTGKTPILTPAYMANGWVDYTIPTGVLSGLGAGFGVRYLGKTFGDAVNVVVNDPLTLYDAAIHYERGNWRYSVNATNLFDKHFVTCSGSAALGVCYQGGRQQVIGKVSYRW
ncbi:MAG TPA: TonB-dependent siderophore receptor [Afipia sp.]